MNLVDKCLSDEDDLIRAIATTEGPMAATDFMRLHNNLCIQYAGFEHALTVIPMCNRWLAPRTNLSTLEH